LSKRAEEEEEEEKKVVSQRYCQLIFVMVMIIFDDVVGTDLSCLLAKQESRRCTSPKGINKMMFVMVMHSVFFVVVFGCHDVRPVCVLLKVFLM
jgi:hypothetical protein